MSAIFADERTVWFLMRGTGVVVQALLTLAVVLGILATARIGGRFWPQSATQSVHRTVSLLATTLLAAHVVLAVVHSYVDIRWWEAFVPFAGTYRPLWVGLGAVALDLIALVVATSLLRRGLRHRTWRGVHLMAYLAWAVGVVHGLGIGTDARTSWAGGATAVEVSLVLLAGVVRLVTLRRERAYAHGPVPERVRVGL